MIGQAFAGLAAGGAYALLGVCLILSYRVGAVVNFSQSFVGTFAAYVMAWLVGRGLGHWEAIGIGIAVGAAVGALQGAVIARWFSEAGELVRSTVTIAMAIGFFGLTVRLFGDAPRLFPRLFPTLHVTVSGIFLDGISISSAIAAVALSFVLWLVLAFTRVGVVLRAVASRTTTAELLGVPARLVIVAVWAMTAGLTSAAIILIAPTRGSIPELSLLVVPALAAALFGAMRSFALTVLGGFAIAVVQSMSYTWQSISPYQSAFPFVVVTAVLLWSQRRAVWGEAR